MSDIFVTFGGWIAALAVAVIGAFVQWRKGSVDESALVLGKWKELVDAHQSQIETLNSEIRLLRVENTDLRQRLDKAEKRIRDQDEEIAGLKRAIIQNSRSAVLRLNQGGQP